ncbi:glutamate dehydrogenase, partial [Shigella flexneri]
SNNTACVFTGKGLSFGGSLIRKLPATVWFISQKQC